MERRAERSYLSALTSGSLEQNVPLVLAEETVKRSS
jgi:hypothetical protein